MPTRSARPSVRETFAPAVLAALREAGTPLTVAELLLRLPVERPADQTVRHILADLIAAGSVVPGERTVRRPTGMGTGAWRVLTVAAAKREAE